MTTPEAINFNDLDNLLAKGRELKELLTETPEILSFLKLIRDMGDSKAALPVQTDTLLLAGQAASVLGVDKATIYRYVREGILQPYCVPHSSYMRFWLSDIKAIPKKEAIA